MAEALPDSLGQLIRVARERLAAAGVVDSALDARLLVEHLSETTRAEAIADPGRKVDAGSLKMIEQALERRMAGEPAHRIMGFRDFYGLRFMVSSETLEPRPDTETLVDAVLPSVKAVVERDGQCRVLDLGTGTGAIALAVLDAVHQAHATGVDISRDALTTARQNAQKLGFSSRFTSLESDWFSNVSGRYHLIVSNPPYIKSHDIDALQVEVRKYDPRRALDGGHDGLDAYRTIAEGAHKYLEPDGIVAVEIGATQKSDVISVFQNSGFTVVNGVADLAGHDRVLVFRVKQKAEDSVEITLGKALE